MIDLRTDPPIQPRGGGSRYWEIAPDPRLSRYVRSYCFSSDTGDRAGEVTRRIVPDGSVDLLFSIGREGRAAGEVFGIKSGHRMVGGVGPTQNLAVSFRAGTAARLLGVAADELSDRVIDIGAILGSGGDEWVRAYGNAPGWGPRRRLVERMLLDRLERVVARVGREIVDCAVARIVRRRGDVAIRELAMALGVGERRLERLFGYEVGLSPKRFARVIRFRSALDALVAGGSQVQAALAFGYFDQSHLLRDFRALAGVAPGKLVGVSDSSNRSE